MSKVIPIGGWVNFSAGVGAGGSDKKTVSLDFRSPGRTRVVQTLGTRLVAQWAIDCVTLSESVSLVNDNFQTEPISKLKTAR